MLYPQTNPYRQYHDLSGFWEFRPDPDQVGERSGWINGVSGGQPIAVPASWNELLADVYHYLGDAWYQTRFDLPWGWQDKRAWVRFGSVNYIAEVWLNGVNLGGHEGGHLPFEFDITDHLQVQDNVLVVRVNGELSPDHVPPGNIRRDPLDGFPSPSCPDTNFDFYPFCGIHRPVLLYATALESITDLTVVTNIDGGDGQVRVRADCAPGTTATVRLTLTGYGVQIAGEAAFSGESTEITLTVPDAALWSPGAPYLYDLTAELVRDGEIIDRYTLPVGIRTIQVNGDQLLLNGKPIILTGFGRHEDFHLVGRGYMPAVVIKDYDLMRWINANSFRTSHYPYSEQMMALADRLGFLVIDETPAVGLYFHEDGLKRRMVVWEQQIRELIARDKNHPSVIVWSLANEPHSRRPVAKSSFKKMFDVARGLDSSRPVTFASHLGLEDQAIEFCDVLCLNRYFGWYTESGQLDRAVERLSAELDDLHAAYPRPLILSEFGTDTVAGKHTHPPVMFSEEYQTEFLTRYIELLTRKSYVVGQHVWNMCDFRVGQSIHRVGSLNLKGVFTREREPKMAAHRLRELWQSLIHQEAK